MILTYHPDSLLGKDENGNPVRRSKAKHPYNYDEFVVYRGHPNEVGNHTLWSDRLAQHYPEQWKPLLHKYFNGESEGFSHRPAEKVEEFLKELLNETELKLVYIMEGCNASNGYAYWRFKVYLPRFDCKRVMS